MGGDTSQIINRLRMRHVRCFLAVARSGSVTAAAEQLNSSQPALSRTVSELEELIGQPLFVRTGHGLTLTDAGSGLRRHLDMAMSQIETGTLAASGELARARVSVGMLPNVARTLAIDAAAAFKATEPGVDLELHWSGVAPLLDKLHRNEIDFLLGRLLSLEHLQGVSFEHLYSESIVFVVAQDHPFAAMPDDVSLNDLQRELVLTPLPNTIVRRELDKFLAARGISSFPNQIETVSFEFMRSFLAKHQAIACLPIGAVREELADRRFVQLGIHGEELVSSVGMTFASGRSLNIQAVAFAEHVRAAAQQYL